MKHQNLSTAGSMILVMVLATAWHVEAGDLNPPPGAIASTNCTQINEDAIGPLPFVISDPGCYVLTSNLNGVSGQNGITILADNVTIDLNGFALIGVTGSLDGIRADGTRKNIEIRNGTATGWGGCGIDVGKSTNHLLRDLRVSDNSGLSGLQAGPGSVVVNCTATGNTQLGIAVTGTPGMASTVSHCTATNNPGAGFFVAFSTISDCVASSNGSDGIRVNTECTALRNMCINNGAGTNDAGILVAGVKNRIEGNHVICNGRGIAVVGVINLIIKNSATSSTGTGTPSANYHIIANNHYGAIVSFPGAGFTNSNPWANFQF